MKKTSYVALAALLVLCALGVLLYFSGENTGEAVRETVAQESVEPEEMEAYTSPVDFPALQAVNPEIYAWLYIPNTEISYPLVQHSDDDAYYLNHDSEGNSYSGGAIFTEWAYNGTEFTDPVTIAYGHQMRSGAMFGQLQAIYSDSNGITDCSEVVIYLPERELHFTVFAAVPYDNRHILYTYNFNNQRMYSAFLDSIYSVREIGAVFNDEITVSTDDQLLILSTCLRGNSQKRYLVLAKCVEDIT